MPIYLASWHYSLNPFTPTIICITGQLFHNGVDGENLNFLLHVMLRLWSTAWYGKTLELSAVPKHSVYNTFTFPNDYYSNTGNDMNITNPNKFKKKNGLRPALYIHVLLERRQKNRNFVPEALHTMLFFITVGVWVNLRVPRLIPQGPKVHSWIKPPITLR